MTIFFHASDLVRWATVLLLAASVVFIAASPRPAPDEPHAPVEVSPAPGLPRTVDWGLYQMLWSRRYGDILDSELKKFSSKPAYVMFYRDLGRAFPRRAIEPINRIGATAIVSLELWQWHGRQRGSYLPLINSGEFDDFFKQWARDAKNYGKRVMLRFGFECNGDWFSWSLDPPAYVSAWRRARRIFVAAGAANVKWVWSPNIMSVPDRPDNDMHLYYPGDEYVDWVSLDGYNFGENHDRWHHWESFEQVFGKTLRDFARRYPHKPMIISEFGCAPGKPGQRPRWIRDAYAFVTRFPNVKAVVWFDYDKRRENEPNWRIDVTPESLKAFNETFAKPRRPEPASP